LQLKAEDTQLLENQPTLEILCTHLISIAGLVQSSSPPLNYVSKFLQQEPMIVPRQSKLEHLQALVIADEVIKTIVKTGKNFLNCTSVQTDYKSCTVNKPKLLTLLFAGQITSSLANYLVLS
jgi:hypothetical protein